MIQDNNFNSIEIESELQQFNKNFSAFNALQLY